MEESYTIEGNESTEKVSFIKTISKHLKQDAQDEAILVNGLIDAINNCRDGKEIHAYLTSMKKERKWYGIGNTINRVVHRLHHSGLLEESFPSTWAIIANNPANKKHFESVLSTIHAGTEGKLLDAIKQAAINPSGGSHHIINLDSEEVHEANAQGNKLVVSYSNCGLIDSNSSIYYVI